MHEYKHMYELYMLDVRMKFSILSTEIEELAFNPSVLAQIHSPTT